MRLGWVGTLELELELELWALGFGALGWGDWSVLRTSLSAAREGRVDRQ